MVHIDWEEIKILVRPEEIEEQGCIRSKIKDDYYPDLEIEGITPRYYYHKQYRDKDEYTNRILLTKETGEDHSAYFKPFVEDCISKFKDSMKLNTVDIITLIPNGNNKYYKTMMEVAGTISELLGKPRTILLRRQTTEKHKDRSRKSRFEAVHGHFSVDNVELVKGKTIFLIDDVRTSGMSALECSDVLKKAGATRVVTFALGTNTGDPPK